MSKQCPSPAQRAARALLPLAVVFLIQTAAAAAAPMSSHQRPRGHATPHALQTAERQLRAAGHAFRARGAALRRCLRRHGGRAARCARAERALRLAHARLLRSRRRFSLLQRAGSYSTSNGSLQIALDAEGTGATPTVVPAGTASVTWAYMPRMTSSGSEVHYTWPRLGPKATFTPPSGDPVVAAVAVSSEGRNIGSWTSRLQTYPKLSGGKTEEGTSGTKTEEVLRLEGANVQIAASGASAHVVSAPAGTAQIKWAYMRADGSEIHYPWPWTAPTASFTPPAGYPLVAAEAMTSAGTPDGGWSNRVTVVQEAPNEEVKETVKEEPPHEEAKAPHVAVIVEENRSRSEALSGVPFLAKLAGEYGNTTSWHGVNHPSLPNYLALASGSTQGVSSDTCEPSFSGETIGSQLSKAGIGWKAYMETMPSAGYTGCTHETYAKKHNPFAYFPGSNGTHVVPGSQFQTDLSSGSLPDFIWYTPNLVNDGHEGCNSCVNSNLESLVKGLMGSKWYAEGGTIIVTYDEGSDGESPESLIATVVVNANAKGRSLAASGNHYGTLATIEDLYRLPLLGKAGGAQTLLPLIEAATPSGFNTALDSGGWVGESIVGDFSGAVHEIRSSWTNYNSDERVGQLAAHGVRLMPLFNEWSASNIVPWFQKYGRCGSFWKGRTDYGATTAELVNEPGNPYFWGSGAQTDEPKYAALIEEAAKAISGLACKPTLLVSFDGGYEGDNYGRTLIHDDPNLLALGLGWTEHPYGGKVSREGSALGNRSRVTEAYEATHQDQYVTEIGWPTALGLEPTGDSLQWSEAQQAENIAGFVTWAHGLGYVRDVTVFNYRDYGLNDWYGIESSVGLHKASYAKLAELTRAYG